MIRDKLKTVAIDVEAACLLIEAKHTEPAVTLLRFAIEELREVLAKLTKGKDEC